MEKERKSIKDNGKFLLTMATIIVAIIFAIGFSITYFFIVKSIFYGIIGGYALMMIIVLIWYSIEELLY